MASIYHIQEDLLRLFDLIEENEGEISDEQWELLAVTKENLKEKLNGYFKYVKVLEAEANECKAEAKRLTATAKVKENRIERLKNVMLDAVERFGEAGKTNKFIDLPTAKLFTRSSESVNVDDDRVKVLINSFDSYIRELHDSGILYTGQDVDLQGILDAMNANIIAENGPLFEPFTIADLVTLKLDFITNMTVYELFRKGSDVIAAYSKNLFNSKMNYANAKADWKTIIDVNTRINETHKDNDDFDGVTIPTLATVVKKNSLQIK